MALRSSVSSRAIAAFLIEVLALVQIVPIIGISVSEENDLKVIFSAPQPAWIKIGNTTVNNPTQFILTNLKVRINNKSGVVVVNMYNDTIYVIDMHGLIRQYNLFNFFVTSNSLSYFAYVGVYRNKLVFVSPRAENIIGIGARFYICLLIIDPFTNNIIVNKYVELGDIQGYASILDSPGSPTILNPQSYEIEFLNNTMILSVYSAIYTINESLYKEGYILAFIDTRNWSALNSYFIEIPDVFKNTSVARLVGWATFNDRGQLFYIINNGDAQYVLDVFGGLYDVHGMKLGNILSDEFIMDCVPNGNSFLLASYDVYSLNLYRIINSSNDLYIIRIRSYNINYVPKYIKIINETLFVLNQKNRLLIYSPGIKVVTNFSAPRFLVDNKRGAILYPFLYLDCSNTLCTCTSVLKAVTSDLLIGKQILGTAFFNYDSIAGIVQSNSTYATTAKYIDIDEDGVPELLFSIGCNIFMTKVSHKFIFSPLDEPLIIPMLLVLVSIIIVLYTSNRYKNYFLSIK